MWNTGGIAGLILGFISTAYLFASQWIGQMETAIWVGTSLNMVLWCMKFAGCIWTMFFFMKKFASDNPDITNSDTFHLGIIMALSSAIVYAAFSFANVAFISADLFAEQMEQTLQALAPMMDSNTMSQMDKMMERLPQITFFSNLAYCFLYGLFLAFILSRNIPGKDPFADYKPQEQQS